MILQDNTGTLLDMALNASPAAGGTGDGEKGNGDEQPKSLAIPWLVSAPNFNISTCME